MAKAVSVNGETLPKRKVGPEKTAVQMQCNRGAMALRGRGVSAIPANGQGSAAYRRLIQSKSWRKPAKVYKMSHVSGKTVINLVEAA